VRLGMPDAAVKMYGCITMRLCIIYQPTEQSTTHALGPFVHVVIMSSTYSKRPLVINGLTHPRTQGHRRGQHLNGRLSQLRQGP
jgi:hypothetical protein